MTQPVREKLVPEKSPIQHTPGPWRVSRDSRMDNQGKKYGLEIVANVPQNQRRPWESAGYVPLCDIYRPCNPIISVQDYTPSIETQILDTREANARLIVAAPAMKAALEEIAALEVIAYRRTKLKAVALKALAILRAIEGA